jgi:cytochrome c-type biogenesis protein CcsB
MGIILFVFAVSIGVATFIEHNYGTSTAQAVVYNARWFELLLFLGIINITGIIIRHKLYRKEKLPLFIFHLAFVIILIGSSITRYFGVEGVMHIRQGETTNQIISEATYFYANAQSKGAISESSEKVLFSALSKNYHKLRLNCKGMKIEVECSQIIPNAMEVVNECPDGRPIIELVVAGREGRRNILLASGKTKDAGAFSISFNDSSNINGVTIVRNGSGMFIRSPFKMVQVNMGDQSRDSLKSCEFNPFNLKTLYVIGGVQLVARNYYPSATIDVKSMPVESEGSLPDALRLKVSIGAQHEELLYLAEKEALNHTITFVMKGINLTIGYGSKIIDLPFSLKLDTFILGRYPGSNSPSGFESKITLLDSVRGINGQRRIFMNNVLRYRGYRFYQSSYDNDEMGTVLSVNKNFWGNLFTYLGYGLMVLGMMCSLFTKNSRFVYLSKYLTELREKKKALGKASLVLFFAIVTSFGLSAQTIPDSFIIPKAHAALFGKILIQDPNGRIKPMNTLSSELIRKISRRTEISGQNSDQVLLGMMVFPDVWQHVPMIKASHPQINELLKSKGSRISYQSLFAAAKDHRYILSENVAEAFTRKPSERSKLESELIRFDERANLCYLIYAGKLFRIFPKPGDRSNTWYTPETAEGHFTADDELFVAKSLQLYVETVKKSLKTGNWDEANTIVESFSRFQKKYGADVLPSTAKINAELFYNKLDVFQWLSSIYGLIGLILLIFQFVSVFKPYRNIKMINKIAFVGIFICFVFHAAGLGLRWYISGHAPWSNGYESMIYIGFATILAGILFYRKSAMALSVTAILTMIILNVAQLSWMDPEITNLVPVLKSYWLVIHVAVITASYSFLALGALLAFFNLVFMFTQSVKNYKLLEITISELSAVIEMALIIGLYLLAIGTFIGGVWANESWGRCWGWDSKETWALITVLWYALVLHFRLILRLKGMLLFNILALVSFSTVIMTYFGVNYYLAGLHSYAKGDTVAIPSFVYFISAAMGIVILLAIINQKMFLKGKLQDV